MKKQSFILYITSLILFVAFIYVAPVFTNNSSAHLVPDIALVEETLSPPIDVPIYNRYVQQGILTPIQALQIIRDDKAYTNLFITDLTLKDSSLYKINALSSTDEYLFKIDAKTGKIIDSEKERESTRMNQFDGILIIEEIINKLQAMEEYRNMIITEIEFDKEDVEYEIKSYTYNNEYEFEINAKTGNINSIEIMVTS